MIHLTRSNHTPLVLNSDLIECIETTPDTVVSLTNGVKLRVLESPEEIIIKVASFRRSMLTNPPPVRSSATLETGTGTAESSGMHHASNASKEKE